MGNIDMRFKGDVCLELLNVGVSGAALPVLEGFLQSRDLRNQPKLIGGQQLLSSSPPPFLLCCPARVQLCLPRECLCTGRFPHGRRQQRVQSCTYLQGQALPFGKGAGEAYSQLGLFQVYSWQYQGD